MGKAYLMGRNNKPEMNSQITGFLEGLSDNSGFDYVSGKTDGFKLFETAAIIRDTLFRAALREKSVCLCSEDRGFIMAAILAALAGGPDLILPHVMTEQVIMDACKARKAQTVLSDGEQKLNEHLLQIIPDNNEVSVKPISFSRDITCPFLWLYSGGSTGRPIIWPKTPLNLLGEAFFLKEYFKLTRDDTLLASVSPRHIYGLLFSVLLPCVAQACVVNDSPVFPGEIISSAASSKATVYIGAPMHYKALAAGNSNLGNIRLAFSSGGFLDRAHSLAFSRVNKAPVEEVYGSTETGGIAHRSRVRDENEFKPFPVVGGKVEDERLFVKSHFISPGLPLDGEGYFRSGDRVCSSGEGFELLGRVDNVVKVGGNRVELDAVEQKIRTLKTVRDIFIIQVTAKQGRDNAVAAIVVTDTDIKELRRLFRKVLNPVEMPRHILKVDAIPVTPSGKRDRQTALSLIQG
jgi:acyl-coenzyme A synthetase/AMP-(fatty) acid ligase